MAGKKGFTLVEIIVVLVIVGIGATVTIPNFIVSIEQTKAQVARNNLLAISAAQQKYFEDNASYCTSTTPFANCGDILADLNSNLHLSMMGNDPFHYSCSSVTGPPLSYQCIANDGTDKLTLDVTTANGAVVTCVNLAGNPGYCPS